MAPRLISLVPLLLAAGLAQAQPFGRFGYGEPANLPGLILSRSGFVTKAPGATAFTFDQVSASWNPVTTSSSSQVILLGKKDRCPEKASCDLLSPGLRLYFPKGVSLKLNSTVNPFLTWTPLHRLGIDAI